MKIQPLYDRILVQPIVENTTESGILICHPNLVADQMRKGKVLHVGLNCESVKEGDTILYEKHRGVIVEIGKEKQLQIRETDVDAILEEIIR